MSIMGEQKRGCRGNKVFHVNTLMQLSKILGQPPLTDNWVCYEYFEKTCDYFI